LVTAAQVFVERQVESAFRRSADPAVRGIDVRAFLGAARRALPAWSRHVIVARFLLTTVGSALVLLMLAVA
jgi:hypothetical protein